MTTISQGEGKAESEPSGQRCSTFSPTSRGNLTLLQVGAAEQQATLQAMQPPLAQQRDPAHLLTHSSPQKRAKKALGLQQNAVLLRFSTAGQTLCCHSEQGASVAASSPPTQRLRQEWELAAGPQPALGGLSLQKCLRRSSAPHPPTASIRSALQQMKASRMHDFRRMGRGWRKRNRKFQYQTVHLGTAKARTFLMSCKEHLAAKCNSSITTKYQSPEKQIRMCKAFSGNGSDSKTCDIERTSCTGPQPCKGSIRKNPTFVALYFVQFEGGVEIICFYHLYSPPPEEGRVTARCQQGKQTSRSGSSAAYLSGIWQQREAESLTNSNELTSVGSPRKWRRGLCDTKAQQPPAFPCQKVSHEQPARVLVATRDFGS